LIVSTPSAFSPDPSLLRDALDFGLDCAEKAGRITLKYFRTQIEIERKSDDTPVTIADKEAEQFIRAEISRVFPFHRVLGEEFGESGPDSPWRWIIDPVDGTKSFVHGVPFYTVLIALLYENEPVVGIIHNPALKETVGADLHGRGEARGVSVGVSDTRELREAWLQVTDPANFSRLMPDAALRLFQAVGYCRTWADGYGYLLVATGRSDIALDPVMSLWDIAPLKPVIQAAGGRFSDLQGVTSGVGTSALATNGVLHPDVLKLMF
jgi:histidinol-phosphatase